MFVAPVLAIIAYFSVDYVVSEKPQAAVQGGSYKLAAKSNCRYQSGNCTLENGDVEVHIRASRTADSQVGLSVRSELPIQNALISYVVDGIATEPVMMDADPEQAGGFHVTFNLDDPEKSVLRLALYIADTIYYAETSAVFVDYETSFSRDNFSE